MLDYHCLPGANVRSQTYCVARTSVICRHCGQATNVLALAVPAGHEILDPDAETAAEDSGGQRPSAWQHSRGNAFLFFVERLPASVQRRLALLSRSFRLGQEPVPCWTNHCENCGVLFDDHELHCEPDVAFMPSSESIAANIELLTISEPLEAEAGGYACETQFFCSMRKN